MASKLEQANAAWLRLRREVKKENRQWAVDSCIAEIDAIVATMTETEYALHTAFLHTIRKYGG